MTATIEPPTPILTDDPYVELVLREISRRVLWLCAAIVGAANSGRPNYAGVEVGGHQPSRITGAALSLLGS